MNYFTGDRLGNNIKMEGERREILKQFLQEWPVSQSFSRVAEIIAFRQFKMKKPICDLGCGDGLFTEVLFGKKKGTVKAGIDISPKGVGRASERRVYQQVRIADAINLPYPDQSFTTVFSNSSLEHMRNLDKVLLEINRVLKKEGEFIFLVPSQYLDDYFLLSVIFKNLRLFKIAKFTAKMRHRFFKHLHLFGPKKWERKIKKKGFKMEKYYYGGGGKNWLVVELFLPFWLIGALLKKFLGRWVLPPRWPVVFLASTFFNRFLPQKPFGLKGPGLLIVARKVR